MMRLPMRSWRGRWLPGLLCAICLAPSPGAAQTVNMDVVGIIAGPADIVRVNGSFAYVVAGPSLTVFDIGNPAAPARKGSVKLPDAIIGMALSGSRAYVANGLRGLAIVDLANPDMPAVVGSIKTPGEALRVAVTGTKALVVNRLSGVEVIDVSNPAQPVSVGSHYTEGYARDVAVADALAFIVDSSTDLAIVDVSKGTPTALSTQESGVPPGIVAVAQPASASGPRTVYLLGGGVLQVYDVSNPAAPKKGATFKIAGGVQAVAFQGSLGHVAAGANGLQIVDVSDPANPSIVGSYKTTGAARDVATAGPLVLVAVQAGKAGSNAAGASRAGVYILRQR